MKLTTTCLAFAISILLLPCMAAAQPVLTITVDDGQGPVTLTPPGTPVGDGTYNFLGTHTEPGRWTLLYPININPDPHFRTWDNGWYDITSMGSSIQDFSLSFETTVDRPYPGPILIEGDVSVHLDNPATGDAIGPDSNNNPMTTFLIDGQSTAQLLRGFQGVTGQGSAEETLTPFQTSRGINNTIGMQFDFSLSPGATAALDANFFATPVPEPSALSLVFLGVLGAGVVRGLRFTPTKLRYPQIRLLKQL